MSQRDESGFYTGSEERWNALSHGIGAVLSVAALIILVVASVSKGDAWHIVSFSIFGTSLVFLYLASTLYHGIQLGRVKRVLRTADQSAVFVLIAGSYTPFLLTNLRGPWGWSLFGLVWALAIFGCVERIYARNTVKKGSLMIYLFMGWLMIVAIKPLVASVPTPSLIWLAAGGMAYTLGVLFYSWEKLPYAHTIWHIFVIAGSLSHFFAVMNLL